MDKLNQIEKLLQIKNLRRKLAELETAKSRRAMQAAANEVEAALQREASVLQTSNERRQERLNDLISGSGNVAVHSSRAANVFAITNQEIAASQEQTESSRTALTAANERVKTEQAKLARFLQVEERTRKLCERLEEIKHKEAARTG